MGKQILGTIAFTVILFVCIAAAKYFTGVKEWFMEARNWAIPSGVGYFLGYGQGLRNENR